jgi:hypothetical protein
MMETQPWSRGGSELSRGGLKLTKMIDFAKLRSGGSVRRLWPKAADSHHPEEEPGPHPDSHHSEKSDPQVFFPQQSSEPFSSYSSLLFLYLLLSIW